jgi:predicted DNA-binding protein (UPF0251 family)
LICRDRCAREIAANRAGIPRNALKSRRRHAIDQVAHAVVAMRKLRISNHPARSASNATMRAIAG